MPDCLEQENCNTKNQASLSWNFVRRHQLSLQMQLCLLEPESCEMCKYSSHRKLHIFLSCVPSTIMIHL